MTKTTDAPVLETLSAMTVDSIERCGLDDERKADVNGFDGADVRARRRSAANVGQDHNI